MFFRQFFCFNQKKEIQQRVTLLIEGKLHIFLSNGLNMVSGKLHIFRRKMTYSQGVT